jgi:HD domain
MTHDHDPNRFTRRCALHTGGHALVAIATSTLLSGCSSASNAKAQAASAGMGAAGGPPASLPKSVAGIEIPDSSLARAAASLVYSAAPEQLYNHCMRTYVFAALLFEKMSRPFDRELAFVGSALHDLGLLDAFMSPTERFELDSADAARKFLQDHDVPSDRAELVWDAIALHTNVSIAARKAPEIAMVSLGAVMDAAGASLDQLSPQAVEEVIAAFPRLGFKAAAIQTMIALCEKKPDAQLLHPFADVGRRHIPGFVSPTIEDLMLGSPFAE